METSKRLYFIDSLRIALTILVIAHHSGQAYGPLGGSWPVQDTLRAPVLGPFFTVNRSFFMSLFFMISGYLMVMSYDRKGPRAFLKSRLLRLGVPLVVLSLLMVPLPQINIGHLWYIQHLLLLSAGYALWRVVWRNSAKINLGGVKPPGYLAVLVFVLVLAMVSTIIRIWYPLEVWVNFFDLIQVAFADLPRDLSFFVVGALAYRTGWFLKFPTRAGIVWLAVGVASAAFWYAYALGLRDLLPIGQTAMRIIYPIWETLLCCGMCIGLLVLFRKRVNSQGPFGKAMAQSQYAAYLFHPPVVILLQYALTGLGLPALVKFALVFIAGTSLTFLFSYWLRKPAFMKRIL